MNLQQAREQARRIANAHRGSVAIYRKHNGELYLGQSAADVLPSSERIEVIQPATWLWAEEVAQ